MSFKEVSFAYSGKAEDYLYENLDFGVDLDSRVAIVGPNGAGKSTLLKLMIGELVATKGDVGRHGALRIAYYNQHSEAQLKLELNPIEFLQQTFPDGIYLPGNSERVKPEISACNAGSLNYLKARKNGNWAWPPMVFDNPVSKVEEMLGAMKACDSVPEFECFDVGIVRSVNMYVETGMTAHPDYNFVMGVASGMPTDPALLELLVGYRRQGTPWQVTAIGRQEIWPLHQRTADLGGNLRTGLEDTFYLPDGERARGNGDLIDALVQCARNAGREPASPAEAREILLS